MGYTPQILVIGGGVIGTGTARDLAIRGLDVTLVERGTLTAGTTGQTQGVLYSGARVADNPNLARQMYRENQTLRKIASHCIESTGGLLLSSPANTERFEERLDALEDCSLPHEILDGETAREMEPSLADDVERAVSVPDAVVDPFLMTVANAKSAQEYGATVRKHTRVIDIETDGGTIDTVTIEYEPSPEKNTGPAGPTKKTESEKPGGRTDGGVPGGKTDGGTPGGNKTDSKSGKWDSRGPAHTPGGMDITPSLPADVVEELKKEGHELTEELDPDYVVNAAGPWAGEVAALADLSVELEYEAGTTVTVHDTPVETVLTQLRGDDTDTLVPSGQNAVLGTARKTVSGPTERAVSFDDVVTVSNRVSEFVPAVERKETLRADCGIRSWHPDAASNHEYRLLDHGKRDECWGMTTVTGGSLTTHRYIAAQVVDEVCSKFGIRRECQTDQIPVPGSKNPDQTHDALAALEAVPFEVEPGVRRLGDRATDVLGGDEPNPVVCECQAVSRAEIRDALSGEEGIDIDLEEARIRTSATMGACQGGRCAHRIASELYPEYDEETTAHALDSLFAGRWEGQRHALTGPQLARVMRTYMFHVETMNRDTPELTFVASRSEDVEEALEDEERSVAGNTVGLAAFDDGQRETRRDRPPWGERVQ